MKSVHRMLDLYSDCEPYLVWVFDKEGHLIDRVVKEDAPEEIKEKYEEVKRLQEIVEPIR